MPILRCGPYTGLAVAFCLTLSSCGAQAPHDTDADARAAIAEIIEQTEASNNAGDQDSVWSGASRAASAPNPHGSPRTKPRARRLAKPLEVDLAASPTASDERPATRR